MRRFYSVLFFFCLFVVAAQGGSYKLANGETVTGEVITYAGEYVQIKVSADNYTKYKWGDLSQEALKQLYQEATRPADKAYIEPYLEELNQEKARQRAIEIKPVPRVERPTTGIGLFAAFGSPVGLVLIFLVYAANIYAGYEISVYRNMPPTPVCVGSAILPVIAPIAFLCLQKPPAFMKTGPATTTTETTAIAEIAAATSPEALVTEIPAEESGLPPGPSPIPGAGGGPAPAAQLPAPISFKRGEFTFNRRFIETKMPGFFRVVPSEKDKDLVLLVRAARGDFLGRRISRIGPNDFDLEVFKDTVTANEMIPFNEINEIQIRHKDLPLS
jgi:hypothetical protein